jgi:hypothetical protein
VTHATEGQLQDALLLAAPRALPALRLFRRQVHMVRVEGRVMRAGIKGMADLYGVWHGGAHVELELKAAGGRLSPEQEAWRAFCAEWRIPHLVLTAQRGEAVADTVARWLAEIARLTPPGLIR